MTRLTPEREKEIRWTNANISEYLNRDIEDLLDEIDALRKENHSLSIENEKLNQPTAMFGDGPFIVENITIDQRYKFECEVKQLREKLDVANLLTEKCEEMTRQRDQLITVVESWLASTPTNKDGKYCEKNQWHACRALEILKQIGD